MDLEMVLSTKTPHLQLSSSLLNSLPLTNINKQPQISKHVQLQHNNINNINLEESKQLHAHFIKTNFTLSHTHQNPHFTLVPNSSQAANFNLLITSYTKNNKPFDAISLYARMRSTDDVKVDNFVIPSVLKALSQVSMAHVGKELHGYAIKVGLEGDLFVKNALIHMYGECGLVESARVVFDGMLERDGVTWSSIIRCYCRSKLFREAVEVMREMWRKGVRPGDVAMISMVNVFAGLEDVEMGRALHGYVMRSCSFMGREGVCVTTGLIDMYAKCGKLDWARRLFDGLSQKSVVSWTALIAGYVRYNYLKEGALMFAQLVEEEVLPTEITMLTLLIECGVAGALHLGKQIHAYILRNGFGMSVALISALVDMYGKCGEVVSARVLFDDMDTKDVTLWSMMISAYARANCTEKAFDLFSKMRDSGVRPNEVAMVSLLSLCGESGALDMGKWLHAYIDKQEVKVDLVLKTALVDMYAKCGDLEEAHRLFAETPDRDICLWNAMISGFAMHGCGMDALKLLSQMENQDIRPNDITFTAVLHACAHAGLVAEGKFLFDKMVSDYGLIPKIEHYGCMVDLLGRAGLLEEAHNMIKSMPVTPNTIIWGALLAACKLHKDTNLGEVAAKQLLELEPQNCGYSILMSNIYAVAKKWDDVAGVRTAMKNSGMMKEPGVSTIVVNGSPHNFVMGDSRHPQREKIYEMLNEMTVKLRKAGHVPETSAVLQNIDEEEKETALIYHSERLAMAYGLISIAPGNPIRIVKNLRICDDCHAATKLLSRIYGRLIVVRDRNRFHHFKDGFCSCGDYW